MIFFILSQSPSLIGQKFFYKVETFSVSVLSQIQTT